MKRLLAILLLVVILAGCANSPFPEAHEGYYSAQENASRFIKTGQTFNGGTIAVIEDVETGVLYLEVSYANDPSRTIFPWLNTDGKPMLAESWTK